MERDTAKDRRRLQGIGCVRHAALQGAEVAASRQGPLDRLAQRQSA